MSAAISRREKSGRLGASYLTGVSKRAVRPNESYEQQFPRQQFTPFIAELSTKLAKNMAGRGTGQRDIGDILMEEGTRAAQRLEAGELLVCYQSDWNPQLVDVPLVGT